jgi:uncharacterized repeat protein (TIGR01451 family)
MKTNSFPLSARYLILVLVAFAGFTYCLSVPTRSAGSNASGATAKSVLGSVPAALDSATASGDRAAPGEETDTWKEMTAGLPLMRMVAPMGVSGPSISGTKTHNPPGPAGPFHLGDTINYKVVITDATADATGVTFADTPDPNTTLVAGSVAASPVAVPDSYQCTGNLSISVPAPGVLGNDYLGLNPTATITASDTSTSNATVTVAADGSFTYEPNAGFTGMDQFHYTLSNSVASSIGTVTVTVSNRIWFINNTAAACTSGTCGTFAHPFSSLSSFITENLDQPVAGNKDAIFIYQGSGSYSGALMLKANERLIGQGDALTPTTLGFTPAADGPTLPGATGKPTLSGTNSAGVPAIKLNNGVFVVGLDVSTGVGDGIDGSSISTSVTVGDSPATATNALTVTTTTGTAVSLNTVAGTFAFRSISANGGTNGIVLTGTTGSFMVTGDGTSTANGSGGTIQSTHSGSSVGISLSSAPNVTLTAMNLSNFGVGAIKGTTVTAFTMDYCTISGTNGDATQQDSINLANLLGSCSIDHCSISGGWSDNLRVVNTTGTLSRLSVTNTTFGNLASGSAVTDKAFAFEGNTGVTEMDVTVDHCTFTQAPGDHFNGSINEALMDIVFTNNTLTNNVPSNGGGGITISAGDGSGTPTLTYNVASNNFSDSNGNAITISKGLGPGTAHGTVSNNTIGVANTADSGTAAGAGISFLANGSGTFTTVVSGNTIQEYDVLGIWVRDNQGSCTLNGTFTGNTIRQPGNTNDLDYGIDVEIGSGEGTDTGTGNILISGNVLHGSGTGGNGIADVGLDSNDPSTHLNLSKGTCTSCGSALQVIQTLNPPATVTESDTGNVTLVTTNPATLMFAPGGVDRADPAAADEYRMTRARARLHDSRGALSILNQRSLDFIVKAARERWKATGLTGEQIALLGKMRFGVADLTHGYLGLSEPDRVVFDRKGAGHGWFVDPTPMDDREFAKPVSSTLLYSDPYSAPAGRLDLLTATMHEMGHRLGLVDTLIAQKRDSIMYEALSLGERRLPAKSESARANPSGNAFPQQDSASSAETEDVLRAVKGKNENEEEVKKVIKLHDSVLNWMSRAAMLRWQLAGASPQELERMQAATLEIADLKSDKLALTTSTKIQLDGDAAGYGWFVDPTPQDDSKFALPIFDREFQADLESDAFGHIDLLTVLMHAYGAVAGIEESKAVDTMQAWLMKSWLPTGVRRVPNAGAASFSAPASEQNASDETEPRRAVSRPKSGVTPQASGVSVGPIPTLPAGESVTIVFSVTVNNPLTSPSTATSVSNTGTISGGNFTTVNTSTDTAQLCVPTTITTPLSNQQVAQGTTATFTTTLTGSAPFTFVWKQGSTTLVNGTGGVTITTSTTGSSTTSTLSITNTTTADSGTYSADGSDVAACGDPATHQTATLTVVSPPTITKAFSPTTIPVGGTTTLTFTLTNPNAIVLTGVGFTDTLPAGLTVPNGTTPECSGSLVVSSNVITFSGGTIAASGTCTFSVTVTGTTAGLKTNTTSAPTSNEGGTGVAGTANLTVIAPPTISKAFVLISQIAPSPIGATESGSTVTITTNTPHTFLVGQSVTISGVGVAGYNGTFTIASVPSPTTFTYTDTNTGLAASGGGTATVAENTMPLNGIVTLVFTLTNPNPSSLTGVAFSDALPSGLQVAATPNASAPCGTFAPSAGATSLSFSAGTLAASATCIVSVNVTGTTAGLKNNTTGNVTSNEGGTGGTASASITVLSPPSISKAFGVASISPGGTTTLTFTITNPNASNQLVGVGFSDALPAGLAVAATPGASTSCGGTFAPNAGDTTLNFNGGTIAAAGTCTISVNVTATSPGVKNNTTGNVNSANAGQGNTASATLTVASPPTITKAFSPTTIPLNGVSTLTLTLTNPNSGTTLTGVNFSDNFNPGLQVANPAGIGSTCSGTWNATPGDTFLNFGGGTLPPSSSCTLTVNVTATMAGTITNATNAPQSNEAGFGVASNTATLTVIAPPAISKAFVLNRTIAASPTGATESGSTVTITTTIPHGFLVGQSVMIKGVGVAGYNGTFTIVSVPSPTTFTYTDGTTGLAASGGGTATVGENTMPLNGIVTLMFTLTNPNPSSLSGVSFTDPLPSGMQVAATPNASAPCGTFIPNAGDTSLSFTAGSLAGSGTCVVSVDVTATTAGAKNNTTGNVMSTEGGTGGTASASITVLSPPSISKAFGSPNISPGGTTTLTFTITNPNASNQLLGVGFSDTLPSGLAVAATPGASTSCGGTFSPNAGDTTLTFSGGTIAAAGTCTISVNVTATTPGVKNNTTGNVMSANAGQGNTGSATLTVASPPSISKAFGALTIPVGGTTSLTFTITNSNATQTLTGVGFTDSLPSGLQVAATPNASASCGGTFAPNAGDTTLTFTGGTIASSGSCTVSVNVTGTTPGVKNNVSGNVMSNEGGAGNTASASITVVGAPTIAKEFDLISQIAASPTGATESGSTVTITTTAAHHFFAGQSVIIAGVGVAGYNGTFTILTTPTATTFTYTDGTTGLAASGGGTATVNVPGMPLNGLVTLVFTITNPNGTGSLTGVSFTDALPAGLQVAATPNASAPCGTFTPNAGDTTLTFSGGSLAASSSCIIRVDLTSTTAGVKNNTTSAITSNEGGTGPTANASITVVAPPSISKTFGASNIPLNGTTTLSFTITNPNSTVQLTGVGFTDTLPSGLQVASTPGASTSCGGTFTPAAGDTSLTFSGGTIATSGTCTLSVNVTGVTAGAKNNVTGNVTSNEGGQGNTASASLGVATPPTISKVFGAPSILVGASTSLTFTITNPNTTQGLTGVSFTDTLPAGLTVANGTTTTCGGGTATTSASAGTITLTGGAIPASGTCSFLVTVTGATAGVWNNTTGAVSSNESGAGATSNTATLTVIAPPSISKSFDASTIPLNGTSVLTFTVTNPNTTTTLTGVGFTDSLPSGLTVPSGASSTCGGGTLTTTAPGTISVSGGSIPPSSSCTITVTVTGSTAGVKNNTTGAVTSANGGTGAVSNTATITVLAPPTISKSFTPSTIAVGGTSSLTFTITNPNSTVSLTGVGFTDTLPAGVTVATSSTSPCGGTLTTTNPSNISFSGGTVGTGGSNTCTFSVTVTGTTSGVKNNTTGAVTSANGGTGTTSNTATLNVAAAPTISKAFGVATIPLGGTTSLTFTITNPNPSISLSGVAFTDSLPAGLAVASPPGATDSCGGAFSPLAGATSLTFSRGSLAAGGSCTLSVNVTGVAAGVNMNTTGAISATESGAGTTSNTATITVVAPPTISKAFGAPTVALNGTTTVTFTISNPNGTVPVTGVGFSDTLPAGLKVATPPNATSNNITGGTITAVAGSSSISFSGGSIAAAGSGTITVNVTGVTAGVDNNTTGAVTSSNGGTGLGSNTATITVVAPPTIAKAFAKSVVPVGTNTTLTFTLTNPNATVALTGVGFTDTFPSGIAVASTPGASDGCGGTFTAPAGATGVSFSGGTIAAGGSCTITVTITATSGGVKNNTTSAITSANGGTGAPSNTATIDTFDKCLDDTSGKNFIQFSSTTGDYLFTHCGTGGFTLLGKGTVTTVSGMLTITDNQPNVHMVKINYNTASLTGNATVTIFTGQGLSSTYQISDTNPNPVCACQN